MIRDWEEHSLHMDFSGVDVPVGRPSDIDMWYITPQGFVIVGEIKNQIGEFKTFQKRLLSRLIDELKDGGTVLYIIHDKDVHMGDTTVNIGNCLVSEYYWNGQWIEPKIPTTVNEAIKKIMEVVKC
jgi:hypothetical protein